MKVLDILHLLDQDKDSLDISRNTWQKFRSGNPLTVRLQRKLEEHYGMSVDKLLIEISTDEVRRLLGI